MQGNGVWSIVQHGLDRNPTDRLATPSDGPPARRPYSASAKLIFWATYLILLSGLAFSSLLYLSQGTSDPQEIGWQIPFHLLITQDIHWLTIACLAYPLIWLLARRRQALWLPEIRTWIVFALVVVVFAITAFGTSFVYHDFALSMDEFMMRWQSRLLQDGYLLAPVPDGWITLSHALRPGFLLVDTHYQFWAPGYRPGTAFLYAGFSMVGLGPVMNAVFCAASLLVLLRLAMRLLPAGTGAVLFALLLFASSPQFLITGMTPYTMTAHLLATLLWIWLFTLDRPISHMLAIILGCYALGLHHVHVHSSMALPFLVQLAFGQRRWKLAAIYALAYSVAGLGWLFWIDVATWLQGLEPSPVAPASATVNGDLGFVRMAVNQGVTNHGAVDVLHWATNATRLLAWQNLAVLPLVALALVNLRRMPLTMRLLAWSMATSLVPYILLMPSQGHGWGYRYLHQCLGHIALLAGYGWAIAAQNNMGRLCRFSAMLFALSCLVALPLRAVQTEAFVHPFAKTMEYLRTQDADIVLIPTEQIWYGRDLVRNDPLLRNTPIILALEHVPTPDLTRLCAVYRVTFVSENELLKTGMKRRPDQDGQLARLRKHEMARLNPAGCLP